MGEMPLVIRQIKKSNLFISINDWNTIFYLVDNGVPADKKPEQNLCLVTTIY